MKALAQTKAILTRTLGDTLTPEQKNRLKRHLTDGAHVLCGAKTYEFATPAGEYSLEVLALHDEPFYIERVTDDHPWNQLFLSLCRRAGTYMTAKERHDGPEDQKYGPLSKYTHALMQVNQKELKKIIEDL